jgi:hypothetical protein
MQSVFQSDAGVRHSIANHSFDGNQRSTHNSVSSLLNRCCSSLSVRWMIKQRNSTLLYTCARKIDALFQNLLHALAAVESFDDAPVRRSEIII